MGNMQRQTLWEPPKPVMHFMQVPSIKDPRPDLTYDHADWSKLLELATQRDLMLAILLNGFRCGGLRLHRGGKGYALRPDYDPQTSIWISDKEYEADRDKWLMPYKNTIVELLKQI